MSVFGQFHLKAVVSFSILLSAASGQTKDLIRETSQCEEAIALYCKGVQSTKLATDKLASVLNSNKNDADKILLIRELRKGLMPRKTSLVDSDGDGIADINDQFPILPVIRRVTWSVDSIGFAWNVRQKSALLESAESTLETVEV